MCERAQILYGGSAKADNTAAFETEGIDGSFSGRKSFYGNILANG